VSLPEILVIGAGGHALSCIELIERSNQFVVAGLIGTADQVGQQILGYSVLGVDADLSSLRLRVSHAIIAVGQIQSSSLRRRLFDLACNHGYMLPTVVSPTASVSRHAILEAGCVVMHGAVVNANARVGRNVIVNTHAILEHGAKIGAHCHISTGVILNGNVELEEGSFVGSGAIVKEGVRVGKECVIGMGLTIRYDIPDNTRVTSPRPAA
jgi:sugar O-acyltransferase (sialic acid O-acetyltransferase NeuD family)